jgi:hypothetical protein
MMLGIKRRAEALATRKVEAPIKAESAASRADLSEPAGEEMIDG